MLGNTLTDVYSARAVLRTGVVLDGVLEGLTRLGLAGPADILDLGGGTGGLAVQLAQHGHRVTVVDPSPDSLAALDRRAAETGTSDRVRGVQGDAAAVAELIAPGAVDVVLCHSVLEVVDDPGEALRSIGVVLRTPGLVSLLVANRIAAVVARAGSGRLREATRLISDPAGRDSDHDPLTRRFTAAQLTDLVAAGGLEVWQLHGVRVFADVAPPALLDEPTAAEQLLALERAAAEDPGYLAIATQLHALCTRSTP